MGGLLDRAQKARERAAALEGADGVTREDRARILADIEALFLAKRALPPRPKAARKRGLLLPIAANAAAALLLVLGLLLFPPGRSAGYAGARRAGAIGLKVEESLIGRLREESRLALSDRERRIAEIRAELERLRLAPRPAAGGAAAASRAASAEEAAAREAAESARLELERGLRAELAALETESSRRLAALEKERAEAAFLLGQLRGVYAEARRLAASGDREAARSRAAAAGTLLDRIGASGPGGPELAALLREAYAAVDEALLAAARAEAQAEADAQAAARLAGVQAAGGAAGAQAEELSKAREAQEAAESRAALAAAAADRAQARVLELERSLAATRLGLEGELGGAKEELGGAKAALAAANEELAGANEELAAARGELDGARGGLAEARGELEAARLALAEGEARKAERWERSDRLAHELSAELASARPFLPPSAAPTEADIIALLEAKLRLRELAGSQARERGDPAIYDDFDRSLERIALEERRAGEAEAYAKASAALAGLEARLGLEAAADPSADGKPPAAVRPAPAAGPAAAQAPAEDYLGRLDRLLAALVERLR